MDLSIPGSLILAELLRDVGWNLLNSKVRLDALLVLEIVDSICSNLLSAQSHEAAPVYADILCTSASYDRHDGVKGRKRGLERTKKAWHLREKLFQSTPPLDVTDVDKINQGRILGDFGSCFAQLHRIEDTESNWEIRARYYREAGTEETLAIRFGMMYNNVIPIRAAQRKHEEARDLLSPCHELLRRKLGSNLHLIIRFDLLRAL